MNKYSVEMTDSEYMPIDGERILTGPSRRHVMKHLASENGVKLTDSQASLSSFSLPNGNTIFVTLKK